MTRGLPEGLRPAEPAAGSRAEPTHLSAPTPGGPRGAARLLVPLGTGNPLWPPSEARSFTSVQAGGRALAALPCAPLQGSRGGSALPTLVGERQTDRQREIQKAGGGPGANTDPGAGRGMNSTPAGSAPRASPPETRLETVTTKLNSRVRPNPPPWCSRIRGPQMPPCLPPASSPGTSELTLQVTLGPVTGRPGVSSPGWAPSVSPELTRWSRPSLTYMGFVTRTWPQVSCWDSELSSVWLQIPRRNLAPGT